MVGTNFTLNVNSNVTDLLKYFMLTDFFLWNQGVYDWASDSCEEKVWGMLVT